jgi:thiol:disulfide interchange protein DsbA
MRHEMPWVGRLASAIIVSVIGFVAITPAARAVPAGLKGTFQELKEPSTHTPGKVKLTEFADFYCPHCHMFEQGALPILEKEFGDRLEVTMVGFPVIPGKLPTAFDMYEQARAMGKGTEMRRVLFRAIHKDRLQILDHLIRESLIKEVGLDPAAFEAGLATGKPAKAVEQGKKWGQRVEIKQTPTILLDGNIKVERIDPENLIMVIRGILDADGKR